MKVTMATLDEPRVNTRECSQARSMMRCTRCRGLMVEDRCVDLAQLEYIWGCAWRCVNCGNVTDTIIQHHKSLPSATPVISEPVRRLASGQKRKRCAPMRVHIV
jgi:hypothetical protein